MSTPRLFRGSIYHAGAKYTLDGTRSLRHTAEMGQTHITAINEVPCSQFLPGMPEIHYTYTQSHPFALPDWITAACFTRKMDGACILFSPLTLPNGEVVVVARTRGMLPVKDTKWRPLETLLKRASLAGGLEERIGDACRKQKATLVFELYGSDNRHTVTYQDPIALVLHTMIKGKATIQPWRTVEQVGRHFKIPTVEAIAELERFDSSSILRHGEVLVSAMERENDPARGIYRHEGVILNITAGNKGVQWKFKPPSMEEFHRVARTNVCPITVSHTLWKLLDDDLEPTLDHLFTAMRSDYGADPVEDQRSMIESEYWKWFGAQIDAGSIITI